MELASVVAMETGSPDLVLAMASYVFIMWLISVSHLFIGHLSSAVDAYPV